MMQRKGFASFRVGSASACGEADDNNELIQAMGRSIHVRRLVSELSTVLATDYSVVIQGETGTGKELVARYLHRRSPRANGPFVAVDCGAVAENLLENEFFGHEKGAYTGADRQQAGCFESASGGTLFLDEISNLSFNAQALLLRLLQERSVRRLGGNQDIKIDVRVVAASNRDLVEAAREGNFREDLLYRLNDFSVRLPALRQRQDDILYLSRRFMLEANGELKKAVTGFTSEAEQKLLLARWPGNVRQLRSMVRRAMLQAENLIEANHLQISVLGSAFASSMPVAARIEAHSGERLLTALGRQSLKNIVSEYSDKFEAAILIEVLEQTGGNKAEAARLLRVDYKTIYAKLKKFGISMAKESE